MFKKMEEENYGIPLRIIPCDEMEIQLLKSHIGQIILLFDVLIKEPEMLINVGYELQRTCINYEKKIRKEKRKLQALHRIICLIIYLTVLCLGMVTNSRMKSRFNNRHEKVVVLILWRCGDIEQNPGPPLCDIGRDFCKKIISLLVIEYWKSKDGKESYQADYKKKPVEWPENIWFGDPSACKNEQRNAMLQTLLGICIALPNQWLDLIQKYQQLTSKGCQKSQKKQYAHDLKFWLCEQRALEISDQLYDKLSEIEGPRRMDVIELVMDKLDKLKRHKPDLTRDSCFQSMNSENESLKLNGCETKEIASSVPADNETHMSTDPGFSYLDLLADSPLNIKFNLTNSLLSPYTDDATSWESGIKCNKGSKRKVDVDGGQGEFVSSKRQNTAIGPTACQLTSPSTGIQDEDRETTLEDLMTFIDSEMKTSSDENVVLASYNCAQRGVISDIGPSGLVDELGGDLSDDL